MDDFLTEPGDSFLDNGRKNGVITSNHAGFWNTRKKLVFHFITIKGYFHWQHWIEKILGARKSTNRTVYIWLKRFIKSLLFFSYCWGDKKEKYGIEWWVFAFISIGQVWVMLMSSVLWKICSLKQLYQLHESNVLKTVLENFRFNVDECSNNRGRN